MKALKKDTRQLDLFASLEAQADDILALSQIMDAQEQIHKQTDDALAKLPSSGALDAQSRDELDWARCIRASGATKDDIAKCVKSPKVLKALDAVESVLGPGSKPKKQVVEEEFGDSGFGEEKEDAPDGAPRASYGRSTSKKKDSDSNLGATSTTLYLAALRGSKFDPPTAEEEAELGRRIRAGDRGAREELINRNMRLMVSIARRYIKTGRPFDDLIQAGSEGLLVAVDKFDPSIARFSTMATPWIRQRIQLGVAADATMPIPTHLPGYEKKLRAMAQEAKTPEEKRNLELKADKAAKELASRRRMTLSLDSPSLDGDDEEGANALMSLMEAEMPSIEERFQITQIVEKIIYFAHKLGNERARDIFMMRIGFHPSNLGSPVTLADVSDVFNLSRERVRQIYTEAAQEIATAMEYWAKGPENLPEGLRKAIMNPG
jgi:RNA polymerase primary sigma factor